MRIDYYILYITHYPQHNIICTDDKTSHRYKSMYIGAYLVMVDQVKLHLTYDILSMCIIY